MPTLLAFDPEPDSVPESETDPDRDPDPDPEPSQAVKILPQLTWQYARKVALSFPLVDHSCIEPITTPYSGTRVTKRPGWTTGGLLPKASCACLIL